MTSFRNTLAADLRLYKVPLGPHPSMLSMMRHTCAMLVFSPGFACVFWYRVNRWLYVRNVFGWALLNAWRFYRFGNDISCAADIGPGLRIGHPSDIVIGSGARIGRGTIILNGVTIGGKGFERGGEKPTLGDGVYIGTGAKVLGSITIGNNVVIGALTFCDTSIPDDSVAYGNPIRIRPNTPTSSSPQRTRPHAEGLL